MSRALKPLCKTTLIFTSRPTHYFVLYSYVLLLILVLTPWASHGHIQQSEIVLNRVLPHCNFVWITPKSFKIILSHNIIIVINKINTWWSRYAYVNQLWYLATWQGLGFVYVNSSIVDEEALGIKIKNSTRLRGDKESKIVIYKL